MTLAGSMKHKINLFFHGMVEFAGDIFASWSSRLARRFVWVAHVCAGIAVRYLELWQRGGRGAVPYVMIVAMYGLHSSRTCYMQQNPLHVFTQS